MDLVPPYLKGREPFIDRSGVHGPWFGYFTIIVKLHDQWVPKTENVSS
jgi:hypothetical protein